MRKRFLICADFSVSLKVLYCCLAVVVSLCFSGCVSFSFNLPYEAETVENEISSECCSFIFMFRNCSDRTVEKLLVSVKLYEMENFCYEEKFEIKKTVEPDEELSQVLNLTDCLYVSSDDESLCSSISVVHIWYEDGSEFEDF